MVHVWQVLLVDVSGAVSEIKSELEAHADQERAGQQRTYLKSEIGHLGASVPEVRGVVRRFHRDHPSLDRDQLVELAGELWSYPIHEYRLAAVELLAARTKVLNAADLPMMESMLRQASTWALVDPIAIWLVGPIVAADQSSATWLDRWVVDNDFWLRRAALLALLVPLRGGRGDFVRFGRYADDLLDEREFFIAKAIGWVLRDTSKRRPDLVFEWLAPRVGRASGVTLREAVKYLTGPQRAAIEAARSGG